ncbi:endonuclease III [Candidatus Micrarchaeota archaeon]|nr:endonuclease III [Candidatus Micrarchaeota archaeon]
MPHSPKPQFVFKRLRRLFGNATAYSGSEPTAFRILVGTVLSARTKDETTARVANELFKHYDSPEKLARAPLKRIEQLIRPIGFYRAKSRYIHALAQQLLRDFGGLVPDSMEALLSLPGVGRKTASCVLNYAFQKQAIAVDVHVHRIANWLGLVRTKTPEQTEAALKALYPQGQWRHLNNVFVLFGQNLCLPKTPKCGICVLNEVCPVRRQKTEIPLKARFLEGRAVFNQSWRVVGLD